MKLWSVVENGKPLQCIEMAEPVPAGTEILLEVTHCGVCHSDLHFVKGVFDMGGGQVLRITDRGVKLPCAPGHEIAGRVAALGPDAAGVSIGDRRIVYPWIGCGHCAFCLSDRENLCYQSKSLGVIRDGGFGSHVMVPNASYLFDYEGVDPVLAATLPCSGLTVYTAIKNLLPLDRRTPVLLLGAGGLGLIAVTILRALAHENIIVADTNAESRAAALRGGATCAVDNGAADALDKILEAAGGPLHAAIDFVNKDATVSLAMSCLEKGGKLVLVGVGGGEYPLSLAGMIFKPRTIIGTITGSRQNLKDVIALAKQGKLSSVMLTPMPKDQANQALDLLEARKVVGRIVLVE